MKSYSGDLIWLIYSQIPFISNDLIVFGECPFNQNESALLTDLIWSATQKIFAYFRGNHQITVIYSRFLAIPDIDFVLGELIWNAF